MEDGANQSGGTLREDNDAGFIEGGVQNGGISTSDGSGQDSATKQVSAVPSAAVHTLPTQTVNAEIVPPISADNPLETVKIGKKYFVSIFIPPNADERAKGESGKTISLSPQEEVVLRFFLKSKSYEETAASVGIKKDSVRRILGRPNLKRFLQELWDKSAVVSGGDIKQAIKELWDVYYGKTKPDAIQMDALKTITKTLTPRGPGIVINNQQNNNVYNLDSEALNGEWQSAHGAAGGLP